MGDGGIGSRAAAEGGTRDCNSVDAIRGFGVIQSACSGADGCPPHAMAPGMKGLLGPAAILFSILVIVMLGFGLIFPIMPFYVVHFGASGRALGLLMAIYSILQFLFAPVWGRISDRIGRKPVLLIGVAGFAVSFTLQGLAQNLIQLFLARALAGVLSSATLPTALAYIADTTASEDRARGMGLMGAAMGLGMIFGPLVGGPLTRLSFPMPALWPTIFQISVDPTSGEALNLSLPFYASALCSVITIPLVLAALPESLPTSSAARSGAPSPSRARLLIAALSGPMAFLFVMAFLLAFAMANLESVLGLFGKDRFEMGPADVGLVMGMIGVLSVVQQGLLIGPLTKRIGEEQVLRWGLAVSVAGLVGISLVSLMWQMIAFAAVFNAGNSLLRPSVASLISQRARTGQGVAMGLENSFMSLGRAFGPMWAGFAYDFHPSSPFWTAALVQVVALLLYFRYLCAAPGEVIAQAGGVPETDQA